ncbi:MAG TPA: hypothetical protein VGQ36_05105 [Thermoanaerobaculia bacterium]|jgi:hypothetical protein|nr:hypothetical protein [Thermoanaerobaculia bacterium]
MTIFRGLAQQTYQRPPKEIIELLDVVERLEHGGHGDDDAQFHEAVPVESEGTEKPLTATDCHAEGDHARSEHVRITVRVLNRATPKIASGVEVGERERRPAHADLELIVLLRHPRRIERRTGSRRRIHGV